MLRYYEKIGLIKPHYIDLNSSYRYYHTSQFENFNTIRYLRILGMPLDKVSEFLNDRSIGSIKNMLNEQKDEISKKIKELTLIKRKIDNRLVQLESVEKSKPVIIKIKKVPSRKIVWIKKLLKLEMK
ncbi:MerR family transcriptional regulator [Anaerococcus sp. AGMB00486]|uniref:MerR family transcriptional regulator n=2 Tax=Anaerococcus TaxID=165779 RepID=A0ABX2NAD4_9FIRM|nr:MULTISPECIES: MerR family transcriptional regulator [Anaerococcus]MSS77618.1 MerR family transcriptional regulator [Anaerococcus porci]NVF11472.1 MerR family transcriptional regulator [Anaerococcus faecalis]